MRYRIVVNFLGLLPGNLCALTRRVYNVKYARQTTDKAIMPPTKASEEKRKESRQVIDF